VNTTRHSLKKSAWILKFSTNMARVLFFSLFLLSVFLTSPTSAKLTLFTPESLFNRTFQTAQIYFQGLPDNFPNITGRLVPYEFAEQFPGSIVLVYAQPPPEEIIRKVQATGAIAIIITPKSRSLGKCGSFQPVYAKCNNRSRSIPARRGVH
jgi:hypothetical protein